MPLLGKLLPWVLISCFVGAFSVGPHADLLTHHLAHTLGLIAKDKHSTVSAPPSAQQTATISSAPRAWLDNHSIDITASVDAMNPRVTGQPSIQKSINITAQQTWRFGKASDSIFSRSQLESIVGIDGTGGPQPIPNNGIDGTGGPQPTPNAITQDDNNSGGQPDDDQPTFIGKATTALGRLQKTNRYFIVNGIQFTTNRSTRVVVNGKPSAISALHSGHIVSITGKADKSRGVAERITAYSEIRGNITQIKQQSITVLGQTILVQEGATIGGNANRFDDLKVGDTVRISGFKLSNGDLSATRIEREDTQQDDTAGDHITGNISQLNEVEKTFTINHRLTVNYTNTTNTPVLSNGMPLIITGTTNSQDTSIFDAKVLEARAPIVDNNVEKVELEGFITEFTNASHFKIGDVTVSTNLQTAFTGNKRRDLALNIKVEIEGYIDNNNVLVAEKVLFLIANINSHKNRSTLSGPTQTFTWNNVNAKAYRLRIFGKNFTDFYSQTFDSNTTSVTVHGLPESSASILVHLYTLHGDYWCQKSFTFIGPGTIPSPELTSGQKAGTFYKAPPKHSLGVL